MPESEAAATGPAETVVFDFDGTLARGDSYRRYVRFLLRGNPLRLAAAAAFAPLGLPLLRFDGSRRLGLTGFLWLATVGRSAAREVCKRERFLADHAPHPVAAALAALAGDLARGHRVVVATATPRFLAGPLLARLGVVAEVGLVASEPRRRLGGYTAGRYCHGVHKVRMLHAAGFPGPYLRAYTDSASDTPLLDCARTPVLVNGRERDQRRLQRRFGRMLRVVAWR